MEDKITEEVAAPTKQFEGFRKIDKESKHFYKLPNEWTNIMASINNLAELKVIEYLMRHTWGFGEYDQYKHITVDEFMHGRMKDGGTRMDEGTGLKSDRSVKDGLKAAIDHGYILCDVDDKDKARIKKSYKLKMRQVDTTPQNDTQENRQVDTTPQEGNSCPSRTQNLPPDQVAATSRSKKETSGRNFEKEREKESVAPTVAQENQTSPQPDGFSPSLSQNLASSLLPSPEEMKPMKEAKPAPVNYVLFDKLCRKRGYAVDFRVPRNEKNNAAIKDLREQGANAEQVEFVFNDIWDDKDTFWQQHRGNPSVVASQFTARVWKMTAPAQKRRTASGFTNWTEDKSMGVPAEAIGLPAQPAQSAKPANEQSTQSAPVPAQPAQSTKPANEHPAPAPAQPTHPARPTYGPKPDNEPPVHTRLVLDKTARPRSAWARRQQAEKEAHEEQPRQPTRNP